MAQEKLGKRFRILDIDDNGLAEILSASHNNPLTASSADNIAYIHWNEVSDRDGDGYPSAVLDPATGRYRPFDCDDFDPTSFPVEYFEDADGDGYGNPEVSVWACAPPDGFVTNAEDCDDTDPDVHHADDPGCPGASDPDEEGGADRPDEADDASCEGCRAGPAAPGVGAPLLALLALGAARRRRRRGATPPPPRTGGRRGRWRWGRSRWTAPPR